MSGDPKTLGAAIQKTGEVMTQVGAELQTGSTDVKALAEQLTAAANELTAALPKTADAPPENSLPQVPEEEVKEGQEGMGEDGELKQLTGEGPTHFAWRQADREGVEPLQAEGGGKKKKRRGGKSQRAWKKNKKGGRQSKKRR